MAEIVKKKILMLGASVTQVPAIRRAGELGYYVITCSNVKDDPGHEFADEVHFESVLDMDAVLEVARRSGADFILSYALELAAETAAVVAAELGLPGNPPEAIKILTHKDLFREFQRRNGFHAPDSSTMNQEDVAAGRFPELKFPVVVKPVDSSGGRGISIAGGPADLEDAAGLALSYSLKKSILIEEFVEKAGPQLSGDGFMAGGELKFLFLGDHHYNWEINGLVPCATTWPSIMPDQVIQKIRHVTGSLLARAGYISGPFNIDVRFGRDGNVHIIEIGPRSGGLYIPQLIEAATGISLVDLTFDIMHSDTHSNMYNKTNSHTHSNTHNNTHNNIHSNTQINTYSNVHIPDVYKTRCSASYLVHSGKSGYLDALEISEELQNYLISTYAMKKSGDSISAYNGLNSAIAILHMQFENPKMMNYIVSNIQSMIRINYL